MQSYFPNFRFCHLRTEPNVHFFILHKYFRYTNVTNMFYSDLRFQYQLSSKPVIFWRLPESSSHMSILQSYYYMTIKVRLRKDNENENIMEKVSQIILNQDSWKNCFVTIPDIIIIHSYTNLMTLLMSSSSSVCCMAAIKFPRFSSLRVRRPFPDLLM